MILSIGFWDLICAKDEPFRAHEPPKINIKRGRENIPICPRADQRAVINREANLTGPLIKNRTGRRNGCCWTRSILAGTGGEEQDAAEGHDNPRQHPLTTDHRYPKLEIRSFQFSQALRRYWPKRAIFPRTLNHLPFLSRSSQ